MVVHQEFSAYLSKRKLPAMAIIAAAMRKLLLFFLGSKNRLPFDPNYGKHFLLSLDNQDSPYELNK
jgi:hypothetical protein